MTLPHGRRIGICARRVLASLAFVSLLSASPAQSAEPADDLTIRYPMDLPSEYCRGKVTWEQNADYPVELLRLAARLSGKNITIKPFCMEYPTEARRIPMLLAGDEINTVFFGTNPEREEALLAAYVPMFLGTTGLKLFMTRDTLAPELGKVQTLDDLREFSMGQGLGWPDSKILKDNGFTVSNGRYQTLHRMLGAERFDLYPRSYWQIMSEWNWMKGHAPNIVVGTDVALYYPQPIYFFFSPKEPELRDAIETGLKRAFANGTLLELLQTNWETAPSFQQIDLRQTRLFRIENKNITEKTKQAVDEYGLFD
jgi:hypothetical protein